MGDIHLTRELLLGVLRGELPTEMLVQVGLQHLVKLCPYCRREFESFRQEAAAEKGRVDAGLVLASFGAQVTHLEREHRRTERDLQVLLALPWEERAGRIKRSRSRFRGSHLAHLLLEESHRILTANPEEAYQLAELAYLVIQRSPSGRDALNLLTLTCASMGNASRVSGQTRKAEALFFQAREILTQHRVTETAVLARLDDLEGSLRMDQHRLKDAERLFTRAASLYELQDSPVDRARVLLKLAATHNLQGHPGRAVEVTRTALSALSPEREPRLYASARYNLALFLVESGDLREALEVLEEDADLFRSFPEPWLQLRIRGLQGKIAAARGDFATAEAAFLEMREGFLQQGLGYDAAIVSMDLALLYLRQRRTAELKTLAREMLPIFRSQDVHREAVAALVLFQEAARDEQVTAAFVRELIAYLDAARHDPSLRFREG